MAALFSGRQVSSADESAARALALAFTANGGAGDGEGTMAGAPARRASNELSLDSVFRGSESPAPSSFSFDQFFSQRASSQPAPSAGPPTADASASDDDAAHFTQWLEGLKRR